MLTEFLCRGTVGVSQGEMCLDCIELKTCNQEPLNSGAVHPPTCCKTKKKKKYCDNISGYFQLYIFLHNSKQSTITAHFREVFSSRNK